MRLCPESENCCSDKQHDKLELYFATTYFLSITKGILFLVLNLGPIISELNIGNVLQVHSNRTGLISHLKPVDNELTCFKLQSSFYAYYNLLLAVS